MKVSDYLTVERTVILSGTTKAEALGKLIDVMADNVSGLDGRTLAEAVWNREEMMSTGIGHGLGIPHVRLPGLSETYMAVGICPSGISDYESLDGEAVKIIVLIAAPQGQHEVYIRLLAVVADVLKHAEMRQAVIEANDPAEVYRILTEAQA